MAINLLFLNFLSFSAWLTRKIMSGATAGFLILHSLEVYAMSYVKECCTAVLLAHQIR